MKYAEFISEWITPNTCDKWYCHIYYFCLFMFLKSLCFLGIHNSKSIVYGTHHTAWYRFKCNKDIGIEMEQDGYKCWHCAFCDKPIDKDWCDQQTLTYDDVAHGNGFYNEQGWF